MSEGTTQLTELGVGVEPEPELRVRRERAAAADATLVLDGRSRAAAWDDLARQSGLLAALARAVRRARAHVPPGAPSHRIGRVLVDAGVDALEGRWAYAIAQLGADGAVPRAIPDLVAAFGQPGRGPLYQHQPAEGIRRGPLALLAAADVVPTIEVVVTEGIREQRADQRRDCLALVTWLAAVADLEIVASPIEQRWLLEHHRSDLPAEFSERCNGGPNEAAPATEATVAAAREDLAPDGSAVKVLRRLVDATGQRRPQQALATDLPLSAGRISQLLGDLEDRDLVRRYRQRDRKHVEPTPAGRDLVRTLDEEIGRQRRLDSEFSATRQNSRKSRENTRAHGGGEEPAAAAAAEADAPDQEAGGRWRFGWLPWAAHQAAAGTARDGAVVAVDDPDAPTGVGDDGRTRWRSYDEHRDEVVVAAHAGGPLPATVSLALGLAEPSLLRQALPPSRLEGMDLAEDELMLRDARQIGGLSEAALEDPSELHETLIEWGQTIAEMTTTLHNGEAEDRDRLRSEALRSAHGLAGSIVHLLDEAGVDVVRELRVPPHLGADRLDELAEAVALDVAIQSKWRRFAFFRQVYEQRADKRETALITAGDAADPWGELIGSYVLRGQDAHRLAQLVEARLEGPRPVHEDAPEIAVPVPVRMGGRQAVAATLGRCLDALSLRPTREAVSVVAAVTGSPWTAADAVAHLSAEDQPREIAPDELRVALGSLDPARLLPETRRSAARLLQALCRSTQAQTQAELAAAADVTERTVQRSIDLLAALGLATHTNQGYRLTLPTTDERNRADAPRPPALTDDTVAAQDLIYDVVLAVAAPDRLGDPDDPVGRQWTTPGYCWPALRAALPAVTGWIRAARALCGAPAPAADPVEIGPRLTQRAVDAPGTEHRPPTDTDRDRDRDRDPATNTRTEVNS